MRALDCSCGKHLEANNDEDLYGQAREHVDRDHPEMQLSDEQVQGIMAQGAYDKQKVSDAGAAVPRLLARGRGRGRNRPGPAPDPPRRTRVFDVVDAAAGDACGLGFGTSPPRL
jgi:predicted small metal-binding protein